MKKPNKVQAEKLKFIQEYLVYADKEYHPKCGLSITDSDLPFVILYELKVNRLGVRARGWAYHTKEQWHTLENSDITVIYREGLKSDSSFAYYLMCKENTPENINRYNKLIEKENNQCN